MNISDLRVFVDLSDTLHFANTSERHHMSPSTLSRLVKRLESELGAVLLERNNRRVRLTAAGAEFRDFAQQTLSQWSVLKSGLQSRQPGLEGELNLYCSVTASHSLLTQILAVLGEQYPGVELKLHTGDQAESLQRLQGEYEDMVIAAHPGELPASVAFCLLARSPQVFILPRKPGNLRDKLERYIGQSEDFPWGDIPLIVAEQGITRKHLDSWLRVKKIKPQIYAQVAGHEPIVSMVALGCGVAAVPEIVLQGSPVRDSIEILPVPEALPDVEIGLCALRHRLDEPLIRAVWSAAQA